MEEFMEDFEYPSTQDMIKELLGLMLDESGVEDYEIIGNEIFYNSCSALEARYMLGNGNYMRKVNIYELGNKFIELLRFYDEEKIN